MREYTSEEGGCTHRPLFILERRAHTHTHTHMYINVQHDIVYTKETQLLRHVNIAGLNSHAHPHRARRHADTQTYASTTKHQQMI